MFTRKPKNPPMPHTESTAAATRPESTMTLNSKAQTRIIVKYDVGFSNTVYIRGKGANLSWDKGIPMKNIKADEWVWETNEPIHQGEFKVLINDRTYEAGNNHQLRQGAIIQYTPRF